MPILVTANGDAVEAPDGATVADLLEILGLARRVMVVERNGKPIARAERSTTQLSSGDRLELVSAVAGG